MNSEEWTAPAADEIELSIFGRSRGESILLHYGDGRWAIIDSFAERRKPVPLTYLMEIGVDVEHQVELIAASHWHDDHIRGLAQVVEAAPNGAFAMPVAMLRDEFVQFEKRYRQNDDKGVTSGVKEMGRILRILDGRPGAIEWAMSWRTIHAATVSSLSHGSAVEIQVMSPSTYDVTEFLRTIRDDNERPSPIASRAPKFDRNDVSSAMWITVGPLAILLGADLETRADSRSGWKAVLGASQCPQGKAQLMKIAHHGSKTGHHDQVWSKLCTKDIITSLAPWAGGDHRLPTMDDVRRILDLSGEAYATGVSATTSDKHRPQLVGNLLRTKGAKVRQLNPKVGQVRHRWKLGADNRWRTAFRGSACRLNALVH